MPSAISATNATHIPPAPQALQAPPAAFDEDWTWVAIYDDGTTVCEVDDDGQAVHSLAHVDLARVISFTLLPRRDGLPQAIVTLAPDRGQRLIFTRRRRIVLNPLSGEEVARRTIHLLGWQRTVRGQNLKCVTYWFADGTSISADDDQLF